MRRLINLILSKFRGEPRPDEERLHEEVRQERRTFEVRRRRAQRVLDDFHRADGVAGKRVT